MPSRRAGVVLQAGHSRASWQSRAPCARSWCVRIRYRLLSKSMLRRLSVFGKPFICLHALSGIQSKKAKEWVREEKDRQKEIKLKIEKERERERVGGLEGEQHLLTPVDWRIGTSTLTIAITNFKNISWKTSPGTYFFKSFLLWNVVERVQFSGVIKDIYHVLPSFHFYAIFLPSTGCTYSSLRVNRCSSWLNHSYRRNKMALTSPVFFFPCSQRSWNEKSVYIFSLHIITL